MALLRTIGIFARRFENGREIMQSSMFDKTTGALENQDVFQWACHMGSLLENLPSKIFEDEGFDERASNLLELHLSSHDCFAHTDGTFSRVPRSASFSRFSRRRAASLCTRKNAE